MDGTYIVYLYYRRRVPLVFLLFFVLLFLLFFFLLPLRLLPLRLPPISLGTGVTWNTSLFVLFRLTLKLWVFEEDELGILEKTDEDEVSMVGLTGLDGLDGFDLLDWFDWFDWLDWFVAVAVAVAVGLFGLGTVIFGTLILFSRA